MVSLLTLRTAPPELPSWLIEAVPHAYEEAGRVQLQGMPGVEWIRDRSAVNGRGFYRGPREAIALVLRTLEAAKVVKVMGLEHLTPISALLFPTRSPNWPERFRSYQREGAAWCAAMLSNEGAALLADDMGIGKTPQAIAALDAVLNDNDPRLVICPAVVRSHWRSKIVEWGRSDPALWQIYSYEGFRKAAKKGEIAPSTAALISDECHYLSNPSTQRTAAVVDWSLDHPRTARLLLSGTPMTARPRDLWQPLDLGWPGRFGQRPRRQSAGKRHVDFLFTKRYCNGHYEPIPNAPPERPAVWVSDGISRAEELRERLSHVMLRRTKSDVAIELPPRTRIAVEIEIPKQAMRDLNRAAAAIAGGGEWHGGVSSLLSNIEEYKIEAACELAREITAAGSRCLILTTRRETAARLGRELEAPVADGSVEADDRQAILKDAAIGVSTIYAVTTGIDLTGYDNIVFTGLDWVPSVLLQAEARIHRIGQDRPCTIHYLIGRHTIDEVVREKVIERLDSFTAIVGSDDSQLRSDLAGGAEEDLLAAIVAQVMANDR